jgi:ubiquinone/menaquinone biosynthesis C-methylase UbiE
MVTLTQEKGFTSILGDFNDLPFTEDSFDGAWAYTSLLHTPKTVINRPLSEIHRILQPNGVLGLGMIEGETEIYRTTEQVPMPRLFSFYTQTELEEIVRQSGFTVLHTEIFKPGSRRYLNLIAQKISD